MLKFQKNGTNPSKMSAVQLFSCKSKISGYYDTLTWSLRDGLDDLQKMMDEITTACTTCEVHPCVCSDINAYETTDTTKFNEILNKGKPKKAGP